MQLIDTQVGNPNEGMVTVDFRGQGGELVSVKMAAGVGLQNDAAVTHAKAMMVQLTAFAEDRDPSEDRWDHSESNVEEHETRLSDLSEPKSELPVVSSFGDAPSSAARSPFLAIGHLLCVEVRLCLTKTQVSAVSPTVVDIDAKLASGTKTARPSTCRSNQ